MTRPNEADVTTDETDPNVTPESTGTLVTDDRTPVQILLDAIDAHEKEGERIDTTMTALNLTAKDVKAIRKQAKALESAKEALAKLMGGEG